MSPFRVKIDNYLKALNSIGRQVPAFAEGLAMKYLIMKGCKAGILHMKNTRRFAAKIGATTLWPGHKLFHQLFSSCLQAPS